MMRVGEHRDDLVGRVRVLAAALSILLVAIASCFWFAQVLRGSYYRELAENNRLRRLPVRAPRGVIYDRHGRPLVENVPSYNLLLDRSRTRDADASWGFAASILGGTAADFGAVLARQSGQPAFAPVLVDQNLSLAEVARFGVKNLEHPEFEIETGHLRLYRHGAQAAHVLGYLGEATAAELVKAAGSYRAGEAVGKRGIEQTYDRTLRGRQGERVVVVDSRGRLLSETVGERAEPGRDLTLTLDLELQQEAERYLQAQGGVGAVVALDPRNGEILVMASAPTFDPNLFTKRLDAAAWQALVGDPNHPLQNRAIQNTYSPGSIFKIVMAVAGLSEHVVTAKDSVFCAGAETFYDRSFRCWKRAGHGRVTVHEALRESCDVYFYSLGQKLGIDRIARYARQFGLGGPTGVDLGDEKAGLVPDPQWSQRVRRSQWYAGETISVAIGQGPLLATPLQMAVLMAATANGGMQVTPHFVLGAPPRPPADLHLDRAAVAEVRRGLWAVVNENGTGAVARVDGLDVAGKTGTVQVVAQKTWTDSRSLPFAQRDHAWFASFAPGDHPRLVVVVFIEHGGKGSQVAAPLAKRLYEIHFRTDLDNHQPA
jgi:penicillin-binding protein 2